VNTTSFSRWRLWPLLALLVVETIALITVGRLQVEGQPQRWTSYSAFVAALILLTGLLPAWLRPSNEMLIAGCLATTLASVLVIPFNLGDFPDYFLDQRVIQTAPAFLILRLVNGVCIAPLAFHLAARFPLPSQVSKRWLAAVYFSTLGLLLIVLVTRWRWLRVLAAAGLAVLSFGLILGAAYLLLRLSRRVDAQNPRPAQQARLLFAAVSTAALPALLRPLGLVFRIEWMPYPVFLTFLALLPVGIAYAVLRTDLFGIDRALRRGLAYGALSILLLVVYFAFTVTLTALLSRLSPDLRGLAALVGLVVAALAFEPARRRFQRWIDRALYPDRLNFQQAVAEVRQALAQVVRRQQIIRLLITDLPPRLGAEWASLSLAPDPETPGDQPNQPAWNARLVVGGQPLGRYWLGPRRTGPSYDADEQRMLHALVGQAALALAYADTLEAMRQLNRELERRVSQRTAQVIDQQRSLAAYEERQRLARELHDSINQSLFSINLSARALRGLVLRDPQSVVAGLSELEIAAQQAMSEMRALLDQLRAPVEEVSEAVSHNTSQPLDLAQMLTVYCERLRCEPAADGKPPLLEVDLRVPTSLRLPSELAHEAFQIAREGLHNVIKHSGARRATCVIALHGQTLHLEIHDEGRGFDPRQTSAGYGLRGVYERVMALGGRIETRASPGQGAALYIELPCLPSQTV
jgi:signal transduction histidine kinase